MYETVATKKNRLKMVEAIGDPTVPLSEAPMRAWCINASVHTSCASHTSLFLFLIPLITGCASIQYDRVRPGTFQGKVTITWAEPNYFIYEPSPTDPLKFASDGHIIIPKKMYTDGGSIPPFFWGIPGYSPWGYAPAYIIHDWLFVAHHCNYDTDNQYTFEDSARLLAEGIKTLMETHRVPKDEFVEYTIYEAVSSAVAKELWDNGECIPATELEARALDASRKVIFTLDMDR